MSIASELISVFSELNSALKKAAVWNETLEPVDSLKDHFVFELLCYFHAAKAAKVAFEIELSGDKESLEMGLARWPRNPGNKSSFSYLSIRQSDLKEIFQLCPGIFILDKHQKKSRAPDVNLLISGASSSPTYKELLMTWDAKHVARKGKRLSDRDVADFIYTFQQLGSPPQCVKWVAAVSDDLFQKSGVVTNGGPSTEPIEALLENGISETSGFPHAPVTRG